MSDRRPVVPEGLDPNTRQLAVREEMPQSGENATRGLIFGLVWCSVGSALVPLVPVIACAIVAFGAAVAMSMGDRRGQVLALMASLVAGLGGSLLFFGVQEVPNTELSIICSFAVAWAVVSGRMHTGGLVAGAAATALVMIGMDFVSTSLQGTSINEVITSVVDQAVEESIGTLDLDGVTAVLEAKESVVSMWPTIYFVVAAAMVVCSYLGARSGARRAGGQVESDVLVRFDVPLWVAELFALGVAAQLLGPYLPSWQREVATIGANVVMCCRLVLVQQGLSVLQWWMRERRVPVFTRAFLLLAALWLEMSFALTSIAGILDVIFNFRHIPRRRAQISFGSARER
jgi:hypothetical protein